MVKAFTVIFKANPVIYSAGSYGGTSGINLYPSKQEDTRPILVIANIITDVATKYPSATSIEENDVKDVVILDKIVCPVK